LFVIGQLERIFDISDSVAGLKVEKPGGEAGGDTPRTKSPHPYDRYVDNVDNVDSRPDKRMKRHLFLVSKKN